MAVQVEFKGLNPERNMNLKVNLKVPVDSSMATFLIPKRAADLITSHLQGNKHTRDFI